MFVKSEDRTDPRQKYHLMSLAEFQTTIPDVSDQYSDSAFYAIGKPAKCQRINGRSRILTINIPTFNRITVTCYYYISALKCSSKAMHNSLELNVLSHRISSHLISSHLISSHLISSHLISSHLISSHLISSGILWQSQY